MAGDQVTFPSSFRTAPNELKSFVSSKANRLFANPAKRAKTPRNRPEPQFSARVHRTTHLNLPATGRNVLEASSLNLMVVFAAVVSLGAIDMSGPPTEVTQAELMTCAALDSTSQATSLHARAELAELTLSDALLRFVRALARAAAIADYERQHRTIDASSDDEGGNLRMV